MVQVSRCPLVISAKPSSKMGHSDLLLDLEKRTIYDSRLVVRVLKDTQANTISYIPCLGVAPS